MIYMMLYTNNDNINNDSSSNNNNNNNNDNDSNDNTNNDNHDNTIVGYSLQGGAVRVDMHPPVMIVGGAYPPLYPDGGG